MIVKNDRPSMLGISLGSANMALAVFEGADARIIHNQEGSSTTPVVIEFISRHQVEVGEESKKSLYVGQTNCIANFQWRLGTDWTYSFNDVDVTAGQLTAYALKKLSDDARAVVGTLGPVILAIPAEFSDVGREATIDAARDAGLDIAQLIDEPVAAVEFFIKGSNQTEDLVGEVANDKGNDPSSRSYAIVDVGAQYLDISIIEEKEKELRLSKSIRSELVSGAVFDQILIRIVAERFREKTGLALDASSFSPIDAENTKISLSKRRNTSVVVASFDYELSRDLKDKIGVQKDWSLDQIEAHILSEFNTWNARLNELPEGPRRSAAQEKLNNLGIARWMLNTQEQFQKRSIEITRSDFETGISPALSQIKGCCDQLLANVHIQSDELTEVFLIGGSSRIPAVSDAVQKAFDRTPVWNSRADEIVAMGAAVYGARIGLHPPQIETVSPEVDEPNLRGEPLSVENESETAATVVDPLSDVRPRDVEVKKEPSRVRAIDLPQSPEPKPESSRTQGGKFPPPQSTSDRSVAQLIDEREALAKGLFGRRAMAILIVAAIAVVIYSLSKFAATTLLPKELDQADTYVSSSSSSDRVWCVYRNGSNLQFTNFSRTYCRQINGQLFETRALARAEYRRLQLSRKISPLTDTAMVWCANANSVWQMHASGVCTGGAKRFRFESQAKNEHRHLQSSASTASLSSSKPMVWCATSGDYSETTKALCLAKGGKAFNTANAARIEHLGLKSLSPPTVSSSPNSKVWCARASGVTREYRVDCLSRAGGWYVTKEAADREHRRLKSQAVSSTSTAGSVYCYRETPVLYYEPTTKACESGDQEITESEYYGTLSTSQASSLSSSDRVWCVYRNGSNLKFTNFSEAYCRQINGQLFGTRALASAEYRRLKSASSTSTVSLSSPKPMVWCANANSVRQILASSVCAGGAERFRFEWQANTEHRRLKSQAVSSTSTAGSVYCYRETPVLYYEPTTKACESGDNQITRGQYFSSTPGEILIAAAAPISVISENDKRKYRSLFKDGVVVVLVMDARGQAFWNPYYSTSSGRAEDAALHHCEADSLDPLTCQIVDVNGQSTWWRSGAEGSPVAYSHASYGYCAKSYSVKRLPRDICEENLRGKFFPTKGEALAEHRRLKSLSSNSSLSSSKQIMWCANANSVWRILASGVCTDGAARFRFESQAKNEHRHLQSSASTDSLSNSNPMVWCATAENYTSADRERCVAKGGKEFTTYTAARTEHRRLKSASSTSASNSSDISASGQKFVWCLKGKDLPRHTNETNCHRLGGVSHRDLRKAVTATNFVFDATQFGKWTLNSRTTSGQYTVGTGAESGSDAIFGVTFFRKESCRKAWVTFAEKTILSKPSSNVAEGVVRIGMEVTPWQGPVKVDDGWLTTTWESDLGSFLGSLMHGYTLMIQPQKGGFRELSVRISLKGSRAVIVSALRNCLSSR